MGERGALGVYNRARDNGIELLLRDGHGVDDRGAGVWGVIRKVMMRNNTLLTL